MSKDEARLAKIKKLLEQFDQEFKEESKQLESEIRQFGFEKEVAGGLSYRMGFGWSPSKPKKVVAD